MHSRFAALLAAVALVATGAMVGLTNASGTWTVVGQGLAPGEAYALRLDTGADRFRLELVNASDDAKASFSVYAPQGQRAGFFELDRHNRMVEVVAAQGVWTLFVYKAQGGDLTLASHGEAEAAQLKAAEVERREVQLAHYVSQQALGATYTAMLSEEPVLAGVYLKGSAQNFESTLRTEKGIVESVDERQVNAAGAGLIVDSRGSRSTQPQHLAAGPFTAEVKASRMSGSLLLVALYVRAPVFEEPAPAEPQEQPPAAPSPPSNGSSPPASPAPPGNTTGPNQELTVCGVVRPGTAAALLVKPGAMLHLTAQQDAQGWASVYDGHDTLVTATPFAAAGESATVMLSGGGEHVLYAHAQQVEAAIAGAACALRPLALTQRLVATLDGEAAADGGAEAAFELAQPPLEFELRLAEASDSVLGIRGTFAGPGGVAAEVAQPFAFGLWASMAGTAGGEAGDAARGDASGFAHGEARGYVAGTRDASARVDPSKLVEGAWLVSAEAQMAEGDLQAFALVYSRASAQGSAGAEGTA